MTIQERLYEKVSDEYKTFINNIENIPVVEVLDKYAYEKVIKDDILSCLESCEIPDREAKILLKLKNPLESIYHEWLDND